MCPGICVLKIYAFPCGKIYVNDTPIEQSFYIEGVMHTLKPRQVKYAGKGGAPELVQYLMYSEFWEHKKRMEETLAHKEKAEVLLDLSKTDRIGDNVILTVIPKAYKSTYGDRVEIDILTTRTEVAEVWADNPHVRNVYVDSVNTYDFVVDMNKVELKFPCDHNCTEVILARLGLVLADKTPVIVVGNAEREWAMGLLDACGSPLVVLHTTSSAKVRSYPYAAELERLLAKELDWKILELPIKVGVRKLAAIIERCESVVTVDTGILHIAGALHKPIYGIFGHTDGAKTTEDYDKAAVIKGVCPIGAMPCWWEVRCLEGGSTYREKENFGWTSCMQMLKPEDVVSQIKDAL